jgi:hypothetical protein
VQSSQGRKAAPTRSCGSWSGRPRRERAPASSASAAPPWRCLARDFTPPALPPGPDRWQVAPNPVFDTARAATRSQQGCNSVHPCAGPSAPVRGSHGAVVDVARFGSALPRRHRPGGSLGPAGVAFPWFSPRPAPPPPPLALPLWQSVAAVRGPEMKEPKHFVKSVKILLDKFLLLASVFAPSSASEHGKAPGSLPEALPWVPRALPATLRKQRPPGPFNRV